ncbi:MAG: hypothetical protein ABIM44_04935 [candidate division WOR-3 bacterium]
MAKVYKTIRIEEENYNRLVRIKGFMEQKFQKAFSINDTIETLLDLYDVKGGELFATKPEELGFRIIRSGKRP